MITRSGLSAVLGIVVGLPCNYANIRFLNALCSVFPACIVAMLFSVAVLVIYNTVTHWKLKQTKYKEKVFKTIDISGKWC